MAIKDLTEKAWSTIGDRDLMDLVAGMVSIPSPTGEEEVLARHLVAYMTEKGLQATLQPVSEGQANAIGMLQGCKDGRRLLFYSPIDTAFAGRKDEDAPWIDLDARGDQIANAVFDGDVVRGLGAHNPKGHAACAIVAAVALARAEIPLNCDLTVALCAGGMPTNSRPPFPAGYHVGHGVGCAHFLEQGGVPDFAVIAKAGTVSWEEVGVSWFKITVKGILGYAGTRHVVRHHNPILDAAKIIGELEDWFQIYTRENTSGLVAPQASIGCIRGGWPNKPTFIPSACEILIDIRVSPRTSVNDVRRQFAAAFSAILSRHSDIEAEWEMILGIPGSHTDPDHEIIRATIAGWEFANRRAFKAEGGGSGATEANVLRLWGVPTARMGMPPPPAPMQFTGQFSMGEAHLESMKVLTRALIHTALICSENEGLKCT